MAGERLGRHAGRKVEPHGISEPREPRPLATGELTGVRHDRRHQLFLREPTRQELKRLGIPERLSRPAPKAPRPRRQATHFLDEAGPDHPPHALFDPARQIVAVASDRHHERPPSPVPPAPLALEFGDGRPGEFPDLKRPGDAAEVVRMDAGGGRRVNLRQPRVEGRRAAGIGLGLESRPQFGIGRRPLKEALQQGLEVKRGAAGDDGRAAAGVRIGDGVLGRAQPPGGGERLAGSATSTK